jgi:hypothetical protein
MSADAKRRLEKLVIKKGGFRTMGQKLDPNEELDKETLAALLLKDGEVYQHSGDDQIFSDEDMDVLCDRYVSLQSFMRFLLLIVFAEAMKHTPEPLGVLATLTVSKLSILLQMVSRRLEQHRMVDEMPV